MTQPASHRLVTEAALMVESATKVDTDDPRLSDARTPTTHTHPASQVSDSTSTGRAVLTATDGVAARTAIGAGTSSLTLGTTAGTAKAGDYSPPDADPTTKGLVQLTGDLGGSASAPTVPGLAAKQDKTTLGADVAADATVRALIPTLADPFALAVGEESLDRRLLGSIPAAVSGSLYLSYFRARKTETVGNLRMATTSTAAAPTPTLCRMGVYSVAVSGDLTLVAATPNDVALFATANTSYTRAVGAPFTKTAGQTYAVALLIVSAGATPTILGAATFAGPPSDSALSKAPRLAGALIGQTDLPDSVLSGSVVQARRLNYVELLP